MDITSVGKRKRSDEPDIERQSPHRPEDLALAQREVDSHTEQLVATPKMAPESPAAQQLADSKAAQSHSPAGTPAQKQTAQPPRYLYDYVTDKNVASWENDGKKALAAELQAADQTVVAIVLQELLRSALDGRMSAVAAGKLVRQAIFDRPDMDVQSLFLDVVSLLPDADHKSAALRMMLASTDIDPDVMRRVLDVSQLQSIGLVQSTFERMRIRKTTNLLYRQANFNLLREESEGYAKLMTEYFDMVDASSGHQGVDVSVADAAFQRVKALVGAFDLDVGRTLDITMDIGANAVVRAFAFIIRFYRCSSWWPSAQPLDHLKVKEPPVSNFPSWALPDASEHVGFDQMSEEQKMERDVQFWNECKEKGIQAFLDLGARKIVDEDALMEMTVEDEPVADTKTQGDDRRKRAAAYHKYARETKQLPPSGNPEAAQLLGFKLRFYASAARTVQDVLPENLVHFTALLIKIGFISLRDLWPHLYPADDEMGEERTRLEREKAEREARERPGGGLNALALAGSLTDDTVPNNRLLRSERSAATTPRPDKKEEEEEKKEEEEDLPLPENQKLYLLKALLAIGAIPEALFILGRYPWFMDVDPTLPPYLHRVIKFMLAPVIDSVNSGNHSGLSQSSPGVSDTTAGEDGRLPRDQQRPQRSLIKWLQLEGMNKEGNEGRYYYAAWSDILPQCHSLDDVLLLCNSLMTFVGPQIGQDVVVYGTMLRLAREDLTKDGSESNRKRWLDLMTRLLVPASSFTRHNPGLTDELFSLLQLYPLATRFSMYAEWFTGRTSRLPQVKTAFDYIRAEVKNIMRRISNDNVDSQARALGKVAYSASGVLILYMISQIESYSNMTNALVGCMRHFPPLAFDVLTWCLVHSLNGSGSGRDRQQADGMLTSQWLQALSQFVAALIQRYPSYNPAPVLRYVAHELRNGDSTNLEILQQILAQMAGVRLDMEFNEHQLLTMTTGELLVSELLQQVGDKRHLCKDSAKRLVQSLSDGHLAGQILIALAQEWQMYPFREFSRTMPLKVLSNNMDMVGQVFTQYLEVLRITMSVDEFEQSVPGVIELIGEFGLRPSAAFAIWRKAISQRMQEHDSSAKTIAKAKAVDETTEKAKAEPDAAEDEAKTEEPKTEEVVTNADGEVPKDDTGDVIMAETSEETARCHPVLEPIVERLPSVVEDRQNGISVAFFVTFWTLLPCDLHAPEGRYPATKALSAAEKEKRSKSLTSMHPNLLMAHKQKHLEEDAHRLKLYAEGRGLQNRLKAVTARLNQESVHWFDRSRDRDRIDPLHAALLQDCLLPRAMASPLDAHYCFLMVKALHDRGVPGFSMTHFINHLFCKQQLAPIICQCTADEASNFGRFLNDIVWLLTQWHASKETFEREATGQTAQPLPGFVIGPIDYNDSSSWKFMDYEHYRRMVCNCHTFLRNALIWCFDSTEHCHIRNGILVLKAMVNNFPQLTYHGKHLVEAMEKLSNDSRADIKAMAMSILGPLRRGLPKWIMPQAFRLNDASKENKRTTLSKTDEPSGTKLDPSATEFKPATPAPDGPEDGELEDEAKKERTATPKPPERVEIEVPVAASSMDPPRSAVATREPTPAANGTGSAHDLVSSRHNKPLPPPPVARAGRRFAPRNDERYGRLDRPGDSRPAASREPSPSHNNRAHSPPRRDEQSGFVPSVASNSGQPSRSFDIRHGRPGGDRRRDWDSKDDVYSDSRPNSRIPPKPDHRREQGMPLPPSGPRRPVADLDMNRDTSYGRLKAPPDLPPNPRDYNRTSTNNRDDFGNRPTGGGGGPSIHPSRARILPLQTTPSGPRTSNRPPAGAPTGPSPTNPLPPAGPSSSDWQRRQQRPNASSPRGNGPGGDYGFRGASNNWSQPQSIASPMEPARGRQREDLFSRGYRDREQRGYHNPTQRRREEEWGDERRGGWERRDYQNQNQSQQRRPAAQHSASQFEYENRRGFQPRREEERRTPMQGRKRGYDSTGEYGGEKRMRGQ
ncbi:hypothetical protein K470DRAFT_256485 [Piedraia hortae CBS 480.64]|uniref:THO complex subunit 2 n=1 Tax=Piedraia hortae CBS 480.64 TaxID=1314780 RepID=A0A6A7C369_9PEZI|nr:hypothetical protein K470DRAFT_256485 [Piedraia hortae CBS 480.64]